MLRPIVYTISESFLEISLDASRFESQIGQRIPSLFIRAFCFSIAKYG